MRVPRTPVYRITDGAQVHDTYWYRIPPIGGSVPLPDLTFNPQERVLALILNSNPNKIIISSLHYPQRRGQLLFGQHRSGCALLAPVCIPHTKKIPARRIVRVSLTLTWARLHLVVGQYHVRGLSTRNKKWAHSQNARCERASRFYFRALDS
jgi:transposase